MMRFILIILIVLLYFLMPIIGKSNVKPYILICLPVIAYVTIFFMSEECVILMFVLAMMLVFGLNRDKTEERFALPLPLANTKTNTNETQIINMTSACTEQEEFKPNAETLIQDSVYDDSNYRHVLIRHQFETEEEQEPCFFDTQGMSGDIKGF